MAVSGEVAYMVNEARVSHRPKTTTPNKPTATIMLSANPPAILVGAWPVYGEGIEEVGDVDVVEVLDVVVLGWDPIPERAEVSEYTTVPPTLEHSSFTRANIAARQEKRENVSHCSLNGWLDRKTYCPDRFYCNWSHIYNIVRHSKSKMHCRRCKHGCSDYRIQSRVCIYHNKLPTPFVVTHFQRDWIWQFIWKTDESGRWKGDTHGTRRVFGGIWRDFGLRGSKSGRSSRCYRGRYSRS